MKGKKMTTVYKLTTQDNTTHNGCKWIPGEWKETNGEGELCGPGWLHCYTDSLLAILLNSIHAKISNPKLWETEVEGERKDDGQLKSGFTRMRIVKEIPIPTITTEQRVRFAILCAKQVYKDKKWNEWADKWLNEKDRTEEMMWSAVESAWSAAASAAESMMYSGVILDLITIAKKACK